MGCKGHIYTGFSWILKSRIVRQSAAAEDGAALLLRPKQLMKAPAAAVAVFVSSHPLWCTQSGSTKQCTAAAGAGLLLLSG